MMYWICRVLPMLCTAVVYSEKYYSEERCFPLTITENGLRYDHIPQSVNITATCGERSIGQPRVLSVVYSTPIVWSEFCADRQQCCTKTHSKSRCSHEIIDGYIYNCKGSSCVVTLPRLNMSDYCNYEFPCQNFTCWNRWVDITYLCYINELTKEVKSVLPVDDAESRRKEIQMDLSPDESGRRDSSWPRSLVLIPVAAVVVFMYWRKMKWRSVIEPFTRTKAAVYFLLILGLTYFAYSTQSVTS